MVLQSIGPKIALAPDDLAGVATGHSVDANDDTYSILDLCFAATIFS